MRFGINLRGDLAKLSDAEIAAELERLLVEREKFAPKLSGWKSALSQMDWTTVFGRGPLHARIFYKMASGHFGRFKADESGVHVLDCEIKDVRDEIRRRAKMKKKVTEAVA